MLVKVLSYNFNIFRGFICKVGKFVIISNLGIIILFFDNYTPKHYMLIEYYRKLQNKNMLALHDY